MTNRLIETPCLAAFSPSRRRSAKGTPRTWRSTLSQTRTERAIPAMMHASLHAVKTGLTKAGLRPFYWASGRRADLRATAGAPRARALRVRPPDLGPAGRRGGPVSGHVPRGVPGLAAAAARQRAGVAVQD